MANQKVRLVIIDPQNDFCDIPKSECPADPLNSGKTIAPALPVTGAHEDMKRLAKFIERAGDKLYDIHVTLDSHNPLDIAHPSWWTNDKGEKPAPFTMISANDVRKGVWRARNPACQSRSLDYVETLDANKRYQLIIWPEHCLIGHWGHNVHAAVADELDRWARNKLEVVDFITKGTNPFTEHYSAIQAEVPDANDSSTTLNERFIKTLADADLVVIAGEALSHCVANTVRDIANNIGDKNIKKLMLLTDCASSVSGFESLGKEFVSEMTARGMKMTTSVNCLT